MKPGHRLRRNLLAAKTAGDGAELVAEIQGLYGPFIFSELLFQKIWLRGDFDRAAVTTDGRRVRVIHPGRWNRLGGPDFKEARLQFEGAGECVGDVELHLQAGDWEAHGHAKDAAYAGVILHVVLFPPPAGRVTLGGAGREIPVLPLLPWLLHDLEEYAAEAAVELLANRPASRALQGLGGLPEAELEQVLRAHAERRWKQKVHFARLRVQRLGWEAACHHAALEIMGFRFNRAPMLRIAGQWPQAGWRQGGVDVEAVYAGEAEAWALQGVRPANHPRLRLRQYAQWCAAQPGWVAQLEAVVGNFSAADTALATGAARRSSRLRVMREEIAGKICGGAVGGPRLDNLCCDGFFPLLTARGGPDGFGFWFHWFPGDLPPHTNRTLRELGVWGGRGRPAGHGLAQGLLGWLLESESQSSAAAGRGA